MTFVKMGKTSDVPKGKGKVFKIEKKKIAVFNLDGEFYAIDNKCKHKGGPLGEGKLEGEIVTCPWHGWQYNVKTGQQIINPSIKVDTCKIRVVGIDIEVEI